MAQAAPRSAALREMVAHAVDDTLGLSSTDEFCDGFLVDAKRDTLHHVFLQTQGCLRENAMAEFDQIFGEMGVGESLGKLDSLLAAQPVLPDGTRLPLTSTSEARDLTAAATLPAKRQHKLALEQALREVEEENASLQTQYLAAQPALQAASAEIAACKAKVEQSAMQCELWRAQNV